MCKFYGNWDLSNKKLIICVLTTFVNIVLKKELLAL